MKFVLCSLLLATLSMSALAAEKVCTVDMKPISDAMSEESDGPKIVKMTIVIDGKKALVTHFSDGGDSVSNREKVKSGTFSVRENLQDVSDSDSARLNNGELIISHALMTTHSEVLGDIFDAGLDLKAIRRVKVDTIGQATNMGQLAVVEAFDAEGKSMGSFMAGFFVRPCQK